MHEFNTPVLEEGEEAVALEEGELDASWAEVAVSGLQLQPNVEYYIHIRTTNTIGALGVGECAVWLHVGVRGSRVCVCGPRGCTWRVVVP